MAIGAVASGCAGGRGAAQDRAAEVERRVLSPCCYMEPLLTHASPLASELRTEIASRAAAGESAEAIEDSLVVRYGERVRALPRGLVLEPFGLLALVLPLLGALLGLVLWRRRSAARAHARPAAPDRGASPQADDDALAERLDDELAALD